MANERAARRKAVRKPDDICLACFNAQQRFTFPFLVYCVHRRALALFHSTEGTSTFACAPEQLAGVLSKLEAHRPTPRVDSGVAPPPSADAER